MIYYDISTTETSAYRELYIVRDIHTNSFYKFCTNIVKMIRIVFLLFKIVSFFYFWGGGIGGPFKVTKSYCIV